MKTIDLTDAQREQEIQDRIARLRKRLASDRPRDAAALASVILGVLDLLADEL